jgi:hypothetical protein
MESKSIKFTKLNGTIKTILKYRNLKNDKIN